MAIIDKKPTCFYHPIKVICLDDNRDFLDALDLEFSEKFNLLTLTDPELTLRIIENDNQDITQQIFKLFDNINVDTSSDRLIDFKISNLLNIIYNRKRFNQTPILIIDYEMPETNGLEFCQKLQEKKVYKIMLTAEADKDTAIKAFNRGLIDKFILKTNENLYSEITSALNDLTNRYFSDLSFNILNYSNRPINDLFNNELYIQLVNDMLIQTQSIEYYLIDNSGSILFLDRDAKPTWLIMREDRELAEQLKLLEGYDLPEQTITSISKKEKILFLFSEKEYRKPISDWNNYLFDSKNLDNNYYYSVSKSYLTDSIEWSRVFSYSAHTSDSASNSLSLLI